MAGESVIVPHLYFAPRRRHAAFRSKEPRTAHPLLGHSLAKAAAARNTGTSLVGAAPIQKWWQGRSRPWRLSERSYWSRWDRIRLDFDSTASGDVHGLFRRDSTTTTHDVLATANDKPVVKN